MRAGPKPNSTLQPARPPGQPVARPATSGAADFRSLICAPERAQLSLDLNIAAGAAGRLLKGRLAAEIAPGRSERASDSCRWPWAINLSCAGCAHCFGSRPPARDLIRFINERADDGRRLRNAGPTRKWLVDGSGRAGGAKNNCASWARVGSARAGGGKAKRWLAGGAMLDRLDNCRCRPMVVFHYHPFGSKCGAGNVWADLTRDFKSRPEIVGQRRRRHSGRACPCKCEPPLFGLHLCCRWGEKPSDKEVLTPLGQKKSAQFQRLFSGPPQLRARPSERASERATINLVGQAENLLRGASERLSRFPFFAPRPSGRVPGR